MVGTDRATPARIAPSDLPRQAAASIRAGIAGTGLLGRFGYLLATQVVQVAFGLGYWMLTTRVVPTGQVGLAAAGVSIATLLSSLGVMGIGSLLLAEAGSLDPKQVRPVITTGMAIGAVLAGLLALGCYALAPVLGPTVRTLGQHPVDMALFAVGAAALTAGSVFDCAAIGLRRGPAQFARNGVQAALRFGLVLGLALAGVHSALGLLSAWVASLLVSFAVWPAVLRTEAVSAGLRARFVLVREYAGTALRHHVLNLAISSVTYFLPVIAALLVAPEQLAYFSVAQLLSSTVLLPPALLAMSLFAETSGDEQLLRKHIRRTLPVAFVCCGLVVGVFEPGAGFALHLFNARYALHGTTTLRILLLGGIPYVMKDHYVAIRRAQRRLTSAARVVAAATLLEAAGAALGGALFAINGLCAGWLIATVVEGAVFTPTVVRVIRGQTKES